MTVITKDHRSLDKERVRAFVRREYKNMMQHYSWYQTDLTPDERRGHMLAMCMVEDGHEVPGYLVIEDLIQVIRQEIKQED